MAWFNPIEILSKLIPIAQILIVILTIFTIWASVHRGNLEKQEKGKLAQEIAETKSVTGDLRKKNIDLEAELNEKTQRELLRVLENSVSFGVTKKEEPSKTSS